MRRRGLWLTTERPVALSVPQSMARILPQDADGRPLSRLAATLARLPDAWLLLLGRRIGATPVDAVLVHPDIGIALIDVGPRPPDAAHAALRAWFYLEEFDFRFPGELPTVALSIAQEAIEAIGAALAAAFDAAPLLSIEDPDWAGGRARVAVAGRGPRSTRKRRPRRPSREALSHVAPERARLSVR